MSDRRFTILITGSSPSPLLRNGRAGEDCELLFIPFIETRPVLNTPALQRIAVLSRLPVNAVFTSSEAVRAVRSAGMLPSAWTGWCTSGTTLSALREWLGTETKISSADDAASLSVAIVSGRVKEAVFFCGNRRRDDLPESLSAAAVKLEEIIVYETVETPQRIEAEFDAVLFFSPSAVSSFFSVNRLNETIPVFVLGKTTAEVLRKRISNPVIVSDKPDKILLLETAIEYAHANQRI